MILANSTLYMISILLPYIYLECNCATIVQPGQGISLQAFHSLRFSLFGSTQCNLPGFLPELLNLQPLLTPWVELIMCGMNTLRAEGRDTQRFLQKTKSQVCFLVNPDTAVSKVNYRTIILQLRGQHLKNFKTVSMR